MERPKSSLFVRYRIVVTFLCKKFLHKLLRISERIKECTRVVSSTFMVHSGGSKAQFAQRTLNSKCFLFFSRRNISLGSYFVTRGITFQIDTWHRRHLLDTMDLDDEEEKETAAVARTTLDAADDDNHFLNYYLEQIASPAPR